MKFSSTLLLSALAAVSAKKPLKSVELPSSVAKNSKLGQNIMANARKLENAADDEMDMAWLVDYSIKFQGCHHITQWNDEADGQDDVRIATKRLVRFRLCPVGTCDDSSSGGCDSGYGDYIIDMQMYLEAYLQDLEELHEWTCQNYEQNICDCEDGDDKDDAFDGEQCLNNCYANYGLDYCIEEENDDDREEFDMMQAAECAQFEGGNNNNNNGVEYFLGAYCSDQGGEIRMGMFTDDACSLFADDYAGTITYKNFMGESLPYSEQSIVGMECVPCEQLGDVNQDNSNTNTEVEVKEACEQLYDTAGKCENIGGYNQNACNFMKGIKVIRSDGVVQVSSGGSKTAGTFIGLFAVTTVALGGYVYYLKTKLGNGAINL